MKRILVFTDSLGLPRSKPEECKYEETWPYLLEEDGFHVHQVSIGGATVDELFKQVHYHCMYQPDIVIIQSGIVDCAPRALTKFESQFLNHFYISRKVLLYLMPKMVNFLRKNRKITYTSSKNFEENIQKFKRQFSDIPLIWIEIMPATPKYEEKLSGITDNVNHYNSLLSRNLGNQLLETKNMRNGLMSDHIHLNKTGHEYVFTELINKIV